jgi:hypothetical protein
MDPMSCMTIYCSCQPGFALGFLAPVTVENANFDVMVFTLSCCLAAELNLV